jgi:RNA polymerase sigma factor (TIGR02999 family)
MSAQGAGSASAPGEGATLEERRAFDRVFSAAYEELRRLAGRIRRDFPALTLNPTALVDEAWVKLSTSPGLSATSRIHFKRIAARAMRQILVDMARRRSAGKRGGRAAALVTLDESIAAPSTADEVLRLEAALAELARIEPVQALMVEYRFFGGMEVAETAELLGVSEAKVRRDWRAVKAWLAMAMRAAG